VSSVGYRTHLAGTVAAIGTLRDQLPTIEQWGRQMAQVMGAGGRLLAAGNGGSAAEAQHLTAELVGRYRGERPPLSAIALHADTSSLTAITNDYGAQAAFARQVQAHGRPGDILVVLSTSGRSENLLEAVPRARARRMRTLALTGPAPNPLADSCEGAICVDGGSTAHVQEAHLVVVHLLCEAVDTFFQEEEERGQASWLAGV
jgi:D-sedoheptulose 7-phosphate isomerase